MKKILSISAFVLLIVFLILAFTNISKAQDFQNLEAASVINVLFYSIASLFVVQLTIAATLFNSKNKILSICSSTISIIGVFVTYVQVNSGSILDNWNVVFALFFLNFGLSLLIVLSTGDSKNIKNQLFNRIAFLLASLVIILNCVMYLMQLSNEGLKMAYIWLNVISLLVILAHSSLNYKKG